MNKLNTTILNPFWVTGFIDGEGTFFVGITRHSTMALGYQVQLQFTITQHIRDADLMDKFTEFFGCGNIASDGSTKVQFRIRKLSDIKSVLLPFVKDHPLQTQKRLDAAAFFGVLALMETGEHLTVDGLAKIRDIKSTMNRARMLEFKSSDSSLS